MATQWFFKAMGQEVGPVSSAQLRSQALAGTIAADTWVRHGADGKWVLAERVKGLFAEGGQAKGATPSGVTRSTTPPSVSQESSNPPESNSPVSGSPGPSRAVVVSSIAAVVIVVFAVVVVVGLLTRRTEDPVAHAPHVPAEVSQTEKPADSTSAEIAALKAEIDTLKKNSVAKAANPDQTPEPPPPSKPVDPPVETPAPAQTKAIAPPEAKQEDVKSTADIVQIVEPAVTQLEVTDRLGNKIMGSGFLVDARGILVTNYHVIEGATRVTASFKNHSPIRAAGFLVVVPEKDLALLRIAIVPVGVRALALAPSLPRQGEKVAAFGSPLGLQGTVSEGIVSAVREGREVQAMYDSSLGKGTYAKVLGYSTQMTWLQSTAPISKGNSGGPLVNMKGEVLGVNACTRSFAEHNAVSVPQNLNFAVSAVEIKGLLAKALPESPTSFARLPAPRVMPTPKPQPPDPAALEEMRKQIAVLRRIHEQRIVILAQWENAKNRYHQAQVTAVRLSAEYSQIVGQGQTVKQQGALLERRVASLRQSALIERDPQRKADIDLAISQANQEYLLCQQQYQNLDAQASRVNALRSGLASDMQGIESEVARLWGEANQLRQEWLAATDAFGKLGRGELQGAIAVFTEWIVMEGGSPAPYILRGIAYWQGGNEQAARQDFKKATQLDPRQAPKVIRALQEEMKERTSPKAKRPTGPRTPPAPPRLTEEERASQQEKQANSFLELAKKFEKDGQHDTAKKWLKKAIQTAPGSETGKKAKEMLDSLSK